ncbi:MAG: TonB family protein [bacterium]
MAKRKRQLLLTIEQSGKVFHHRMRKERFTVGKHPDNDITVYNEKYPKKHILFSKKNNHYQLRFTKFMQGEVVAKKSRLSFNDMVLHNLLDNKGDSFYYPLTQEKQGHVFIEDAKISFQFVSEPLKGAKDPMIEKFNGYSWTLATLKDFGRDLPFKAIILILIVLNAFLLDFMNKLPVKPVSVLSSSKVPDRFARILVRKPAEASGPESRRRVSRPGEAQEGAAEKAKRNRSEKGPDTVRPETQGVLGLLTGTGKTGQSNSLTDFLLDKGLAKELDDVMTTSTLDIGKGTNDGDIDLDALIAISELGGGVDDIVDEVDAVEAVELGEKGQIQVDQIGGITGTADAVGKRSEDSVRGVLGQYTGRMTYIYNKYLKHNPDIRGKIVVEVEIAANGRVSGVKVVESNFANKEFEREILNFIRRWRYEPIDQGTVTVTYPLFFSKMQ